MNPLNSTVLAASKAADDFASFDVPAWAWLALVGAIVAMLIIDLLLVHRTAHVISIKEATIESAIWISIGLAFGIVLLVWQGGQAGGEYYAGFLIEKSLSIDNVFVWAVIFSFFAVPREFQFRVLFWGIFGALVLRGIFIFAGVSLIERFEWILYIFGAFLLYTAWKIAHHDESEQVDYNANIAMRLVRRLFPTTNEYDGQKLFTKANGKRLATPLFAVLVLIEATDVVFAVDSVPAILAVSREPFIVFAANAFAILGLRSLYFLLGGMQGKFRYLNDRRAVRGAPTDVRVSRRDRARHHRCCARVAAGRRSRPTAGHHRSPQRGRRPLCGRAGRRGSRPIASWVSSGSPTEPSSARRRSEPNR
jgi:tellurite resistance protein TerC